MERIDYSKSARMLIRNEGLDPALRWPLAAVYGETAESERLWTLLNEHTREYWHSRAHFIRSLRALLAPVPLPPTASDQS